MPFNLHFVFTCWACQHSTKYRFSITFRNIQNSFFNYNPIAIFKLTLTIIKNNQKKARIPTFPYHSLFTSPYTLLSQTVLFYHYHMYRRLADSKFFCCLSYCSFCFNNVTGNFHCPLFDIIFQKNTPASILVTMYARAIPNM